MGVESKEEISRFAAEMVALSKRPELRPYLTNTEAKRQDKERKRQEEEEERKKEEWLIESDRRYKIIAKWINENMEELAKDDWAQYQKDAPENHHKALRELRKKGWKLHVRALKVTKPDHEPVNATNCMILFRGSIERAERMIWEEPKPIKSKLVSL
jgi:hypothetical protein